MTTLRGSWNAFSIQAAEEYLITSGFPSPESRDIVVAILSGLGRRRPASLLDIGCGNGSLYGALREQGARVEYTGVDVSEPLLAAARRAYPEAAFVEDDAERLARVTRGFDVVLFSHVLEMLGSPQAALRRAAALAPLVIVRFFEPPDHPVDLVELREMDVGDRTVPYLRRSMSRDYYRLLLADVGCTAVDVYRCEFAKDQVHVLRFGI
jgi:SAM-dependent methyltransferase